MSENQNEKGVPYDPNCYRCREKAGRPRAGADKLCSHHKDEAILIYANENATLREKLATLEAERDRLLAERRDEWNFQFVEEMKAKCNSCTIVERLEAERDDMRRQLEAVCPSCRAVVAHLCNCHPEQYSSALLVGKLATTEAERDRMRKALRKIAYVADGPPYRIAREALVEEKP